jgi:hypothetical protein
LCGSGSTSMGWGHAPIYLGTYKARLNMFILKKNYQFFFDFPMFNHFFFLFSHFCWKVRMTKVKIINFLDDHTIIVLSSDRSIHRWTWRYINPLNNNPNYYNFRNCTSKVRSIQVNILMRLEHEIAGNE